MKTFQVMLFQIGYQLIVLIKIKRLIKYTRRLSEIHQNNYKLKIKQISTLYRKNWLMRRIILQRKRIIQAAISKTVTATRKTVKIKSSTRAVIKNLESLTTICNCNNGKKSYLSSNIINTTLQIKIIRIEGIRTSQIIFCPLTLKLMPQLIRIYNQTLF